MRSMHLSYGADPQAKSMTLIIRPLTIRPVVILREYHHNKVTVLYRRDNAVDPPKQRTDEERKKLPNKPTACSSFLVRRRGEVSA